MVDRLKMCPTSTFETVLAGFDLAAIVSRRPPSLKNIRKKNWRRHCTDCRKKLRTEDAYSQDCSKYYGLSCVDWSAYRCGKLYNVEEAWYDIHS